MSNQQEETQSLGSSTILSSWKKIFTKISTSLLHPLSCIYISNILVSDHLSSWNIFHNPNILVHTAQTGTKSYDNIADIPSSDWIKFFISKLCRFIIFHLNFLLSSSSIVYIILCMYTSRKLHFKKIFSVVTNVWKRLIITFFWSCIIVVMYNVGAVMIIGLIGIISIILLGYKATSILVLLLFIFYFVGFVYLSLIWQLACVVSFLEGVYGLEAMMRSQDLMKGKIGSSLLVGVCGIGYSLIYGWQVVSGGSSSILSRISFAVVCLVLQMNFMMSRLIVQTIVFFVLRSFRHAHINKSSLTDDLEDYLGD